jgi:hypothetical protein
MPTGSKAECLKDGDKVTDPYYPLHWVEEKCWEIVVSTGYRFWPGTSTLIIKQELCTRLHRSSTSIISCRDPLVLERSFADKHLTFEQRMNIIVEVAKKCKNRVGEMICGGVIEEHLLTPSRLIGQTNMNRDNNARRQEFIAKGRPKKLGPGDDESKWSHIHLGRCFC